MKPALFLIPLAALAFTSCDKAKNLANKASSAVREKITDKAADADSAKVDDPLRKLVDQTPEGAVFRKDLPFPTRLEVLTTRRNKMSGRFYQSSAIEKRSDVVNGTQLQVSKLERAGDQVRHATEQSSFSIPSADDPDVAQSTDSPLGETSPSAKPVTFRKTGKTWKADERDGFHAAVLSKQLAPVFDQLLIESALAPRQLWFAKRRIKVGEKLVVAGDSLPMLIAGNAKGTLNLTLESFKAVKGHPCGVFTVTGDFSRKQFPDFDGNFTDEDVTIQSGKIWLSLIYPIILKEELDTIQSFKSGGQGGLVGRGQGTVNVSVEREWKAL